MYGPHRPANSKSKMRPTSGSQPVANFPSHQSFNGHSHTKHQPLSPNQYQTFAQHPWRYTNLNNIKVVYNAQDAKAYIQNIADIWDIKKQPGGADFIGKLLQRVDHITKDTEPPFEFYLDQNHEICYILVLIQTKDTRVEIGYSYHYMTNEMSNNGSMQDHILAERKEIKWFRERARESLRMPAGIVRHMIDNDSSMVEYQTYQLSQPQRQSGMMQTNYDEQHHYSGDQHSQYQHRNEGDHTTNYPYGPTSNVDRKSDHTFRINGR